MQRLEAAIYVLIVLLATLACGSDDSATSKNTKPAKMGKTVKFDDSKWKVTKAEDKGQTMTCGVWGAKKTDGKFIRVEFQVENTTKEQEQIIELPKLVDHKEREFQQWNETSLCLAKDQKTMTLEQLPAGMKKKFVAIFEVPKDAKKLLFMARELAFAGDTRPVKLQF